MIVLPWPLNMQKASHLLKNMTKAQNVVDANFTATVPLSLR